MSSFRTAGSTGPAPTTVWFGKVPDRFTALVPGYVGNNDTARTSFFNARYVKDWVPYNQVISAGPNAVTSSFGAFTTAPDGTTDKAKKLVEATTNSPHAAQAMWETQFYSGEGFSFRLSVFAKAAERTRFALYMSNGGFDSSRAFGGGGRMGCKTVFDLSSGTVAVANTAFTGTGVAYVPLSAEITPFGNGWYRCSMDATMGVGNSNYYSFAVLLDNGSGAAAESTSYNGDGSSGMYFWTSSALPPMAWALNSQAFFDDFTTLANFDLAGTFDSTKTWWLRNQWPAFGGAAGLAVTDPTKLSITEGTKLKIATNSGQNDLAVMSAVWTGGTNYTASQAFSPPMLTECSMSWDDLQPAAEGPTWWATSIYRLISPDPAAGPAATGTSNSGEVDFFEYQVGGGGPDPRLSFFYGPQGASSSLYISSIRAAWGPYKWHTAKQYANATMVVAYNGVIYISSRATIGEQPDISPTAWSVLTATAAGYPADWVAFDFEAQNTYSVLWIPYVRGDLGHLLTFSNDICCPRGHAAYGPVLRNVPGPGVPLNAAPFYTNDGQAFPMMIGTSSNLNTYTDWVRIIK